MEITFRWLKNVQEIILDYREIQGLKSPKICTDVLQKS